MYYIRIGIFSVKTRHGTPWTFITFSITKKQQWLTLDHCTCSLNNSPKDSGGLQKQQVKKKNRMKLKKLCGPFYGWGSTASRLKPLSGGSLLYNTKFPEIPGTHSINLGRMKSWVDFGATQWFWSWDSWIGNPAPRPLSHWG